MNGIRAGKDTGDNNDPLNTTSRTLQEEEAKNKIE